MSRPLLSLFTVDRPALAAFEEELKELFYKDDRDALITLLGFGASFAEQVRAAPRAVDLFLVPESEATGFYASVRRIAKKRALEHAWTSTSPALEGRLREYDIIREDAALARSVDALLDPRRVPWFLRRPGGTAGMVSAAEGEGIAEGLQSKEDLPEEVVHLAEALAGLDGDLLCHDGLL